MRLNLDILLVVMSVIDQSPSTVVSLMQTCRELYPAGVRRLLAERFVLSNNTDFKKIHRWKSAGTYLLPAGQIQPFCRFILNDVQYRAPLLRFLGLQFARRSEKEEAEEERIHTTEVAIDALVELLAVTPYLERLFISVADQFLRLHPPLHNALANLTGLKHLMVLNAGSNTRRLLSTMKSSIVDISVTGDSLAWNWSLGTPDEFLPRCTDTLEDVELRYVRFLATPPLQFSNVRTLTLGSSCHVRVGSLVQWFPNLRELSYDDFKVVRASDSERSSNRVSQANATWPHLERLTGPLPHIYNLGLLCSVRHLVISSFSQRAHEVESLSVVLRHAEPSFLRIHFRSAESNDILDPSVLQRMAPMMRGLTHFSAAVDPGWNATPSRATALSALVCDSISVLHGIGYTA